MLKKNLRKVVLADNAVTAADIEDKYKIITLGSISLARCSR